MPSIGINAGMMLAGKLLGGRLDPYRAYNFLVEIEGIIAGGFTEVSGLEVETKVQRIKEGGINDRVHILPERTEQSDLILKKGQTDVDLLWDWYSDVIVGKVERKNGSIYLLDDQGIPAMWWDFTEAYPIKWAGPTLNAQGNTVAFQSLTLVHHGLTKPPSSKAFGLNRGAVNLSRSL